MTDTMAQIARLATVEAREETGQDVTTEFVDLESRARHLEAVEAQLLTLLLKADEVPEALAVQSQLNNVQAELEQVRGRIRHLDDQTAFATISMEITEEDTGATAGEGDSGWGILEAWSDGARGFVRVASATFVGVATAAPILLLLGGVGFLAHTGLRRLQEAGALGPTDRRRCRLIGFEREDLPAVATHGANR